MYNYVNDFQPEVIPHVNENGDIVDEIHNYKRAKPKNNEDIKIMTGV